MGDTLVEGRSCVREQPSLLRMVRELGLELGSMAGRAESHQPGPGCVVHGQDKEGRPRDGGQAQLRVQIIREVCINEAHQGQAGKANHRTMSGSGPAISR